MLIYLFPQHRHRKQSHPWALTAAQELTNPAHPCRMEDDSKAKGISGSHSPAWARFPIWPLAQHCWPQGKAQGNDCRKSPFLTLKLDLAKHDKIRATLMLLIQPTTSFWRFVFFFSSLCFPAIAWLQPTCIWHITTLFLSLLGRCPVWVPSYSRGRKTRGRAQLWLLLIPNSRLCAPDATEFTTCMLMMHICHLWFLIVFHHEDQLPPLHSHQPSAPTHSRFRSTTSWDCIYTCQNF